MDPKPQYPQPPYIHLMGGISDRRIPVIDRLRSKAVRQLSLNPGVYRISAFLLLKDMTVHYDWIHCAKEIAVHGARPAIAGQQFQGTWSIVRRQQAGRVQVA